MGTDAGIPRLERASREWATAADVLTAAEVADYMRLPVRSVYEYAARGVLPSVRIGRHRRFSRQAIEALIEQRRT